MTETINVTKSPLGVYESARVVVASGGGWTDIYSPPRYQTPETQVEPSRIEQTAAIVSGAHCCHDSTGDATLDIQVSDDDGDWLVVSDLTVGADTLVELPIAKTVIESRVAATLQARVTAGPDVTLHVSFVRQTQEFIEEVS